MTNTFDALNEILSYIKWGNISKDFMGYSRGWIYQRLNGYDGNGNECDFTKQQREQLKEALMELSERITLAAEKL